MKSGYLLHEARDFVVIATGTGKVSANSKTGAMVQIWILARHVSPVDALRSGQDEIICGQCPHRPFLIRQQPAGQKSAPCYVQVFQAPVAIWKKYQRGGYDFLPVSEYSAVLAGRSVRYGAYGDPALIPQSITEAVARASAAQTGYTHQWKTCPVFLKRYIMASVDSDQEAIEAREQGWRTFRVAPYGNTEKIGREISCPASTEAGKRTSCDSCLLCSGRKGNGDARASIVIQDHAGLTVSAAKRNAAKLIQIAA